MGGIGITEMADKNLDIVLQAAAQNISAVLSLPSAGMLRNHKSRLVSEQDGGLILEAPAAESALLDELIRTETPCAISFRSGVFKVVFATRIRRFERDWQLNGHTKIDVVFVDMPAEIKATQKRSDYRVELPPGSELSVRVWRLGPGEYFKPQPSTTKEVKAELRNLSTGGIGVKLTGKDGQLPIICPEDRLRIEIKSSEHAIIIEGMMRAPSVPPANGTIITGIQFKKLEDNIEGRQTMALLVRLVGELQREELRSVRMGLLKTA
jgi:c-di-GMP-binding flagellar brake protein YcgR